MSNEQALLMPEDVHTAFTKNFPKSRISQAWINFAADIAQAIATRAAKPAQEVGLTDEEINAALLAGGDPNWMRFTRSQRASIGRAIIAALRAKGAGHA